MSFASLVVARSRAALMRPASALLRGRVLSRRLSLPTHTVVGLPSLSPTMENGTIAVWKVDEGGSFAAGDVIAEIETDKATVDFEAQDDGVLAKVLVAAGTEVKVGDPIMVVVEEAGDVASFKDFEAERPVAASSPVAASAPVAAPAPAAVPVAAAPPPPAPAAPAGSRLVASPLARKLAADLGYDLAAISGTGPNGRVVASDVAAYTPAAVAPPQAVAATGAGFVDFPVSPQSASIAARLAYSMQTAPHYYLTIELGLGSALALLDRLNAKLGDDDRISVTDLFIKASASATKAVPAVNASWLENGVVRAYERFDVNLVVGADAGLVAPAILDVQRLGLKDIADATKKALADDASPEAYACGTFTVVNLGAFGVSSAAPIVSTPQACALALGTIDTKLVPSSDPEKKFDAVPVLTATLSADHRVVDGAVGAAWLAALKDLIESPDSILL